MSTRLPNLVALFLLPFLLSGVINRVKALWSGRKGPPIWQLVFDVVRLARKQPVYSTTTTPVFRVAPYVFVITALGSALLAPILGGAPLASFPFDFVWFAYVWGLGRVAMMLGALDTGSSFEGMGAAREATFSTILEPVLFLVVGALSIHSGTHTLHEAMVLQWLDGASVVLWIAAILALFIALQVESARMPVDDPTTHLELTMVHEVMVLDHSGRDLAAIQFGSALKLMVGVSLIATLLNPWALGNNTVLAGVANVVLSVVVAVVVGTVESLVARLKLRSVPQYIAVALAAGAVAVLATLWRSGVDR